LTLLYEFSAAHEEYNLFLVSIAENQTYDNFKGVKFVQSGIARDEYIFHIGQVSAIYKNANKI
jgi:hypothetical protein